MRIAILEDDRDQARYIEKSLLEYGHVLEPFVNGGDLLRALHRETFDILILDWDVPDGSVHVVLRWLRENLASRPPALMLSNRSADEDIVAGFAAGADDYIVKPVASTVLIARVTALCRRAYPPPPDGIETYGDYRFDARSEMVAVAGQPVSLTAKEHALALLLFRNLHRPLSRDYIFEALWGRRLGLHTRTLDAHISTVRTKLNLRPGNGYKIVPIYAYGYRLDCFRHLPSLFNHDHNGPPRGNQ